MIDEYYKDLDEIEEMRYGSAGRNYIKVYVKDVLLFGGINEAIMYERLYRWAKKGNDSDGWVYKTKEELEKETTLSREKQDKARRNLERLGILDVTNKKPKGYNAPKLHYRMNKSGYKKLLLESGWKSVKHTNPKSVKDTKQKSVKHTNALYTTKDTTKDTGIKPPLTSGGEEIKKHGEQGNVKLTDTEFADLGRKLTAKFRDELIAELSSYLTTHKTKYIGKTHNLVIQTWSRKDFKADRLARAMEELERQNPGQQQEETLTAEEKKLKDECRICYDAHMARVKIDHDCPRV